MQKSVAKKYFFWSNGSAKSSSELVKLDVYNRNHQKSLRLIEIGTKAKVLFSGNLVWDEKQDLFRKECQLFYPEGVIYLRQNSPFYIAILKYAQFLQPEKRNNQDQPVASVIWLWKLQKLWREQFAKRFRSLSQTAENKSVTKLELNG